ncbi:unnamed protein product [Choristocarpus tenellus]
MDTLRSSAVKCTEFIYDRDHFCATSVHHIGEPCPTPDTEDVQASAPPPTRLKKDRERIFDATRDSSSRRFDVQHPETHVLGLTVWESNSTALPHDPITWHDPAERMHSLDPNTNKRVCHPHAPCQKHAQRVQIGTDDDVYANFKERFEMEATHGSIPCLSTFVK